MGSGISEKETLESTSSEAKEAVKWRGCLSRMASEEQGFAQWRERNTIWEVRKAHGLALALETTGLTQIFGSRWTHL